MAPQIMAFKSLVEKYRANVLSDDEVESLYGSSTLKCILDHLQEEQYGLRSST